MRLPLHPAMLGLLLLAAVGCTAVQARPVHLESLERAAIEWVEISHAASLHTKKRINPAAHGDLLHKLADAFNKAERAPGDETDPPAHLRVTLAIRGVGQVTFTPVDDQLVAATIGGERLLLRSARLRYILSELGRTALH